MPSALKYLCFIFLAPSIIAAVLFFLPQTSHAASFYFSVSGNDSNPCTQAQPCKTLPKASSLSLVAGDSLLFRRGDTFFGDSGGLSFIGITGTQSAPITIGAYGSGSMPVLDGNNKNTWGVRIRQGQWFIVQDIDFREWLNGVAIQTSQNITVRRIISADIQSACVHINGDSSGPSRFVSLSESEIFNCGAVNANGEGVYIGTDGAKPGPDTTSDIEVHHNIIHDLTHEGVECKKRSSRCKVYNNFIYNTGWSGISLGGGTQTSESTSIDNAARGNIVHDAGLRDPNSSAIHVGDGVRAQIYNNVLYNCAKGIDRHCVRVASSQATGSIYHNTMYKAPAACTSSPSGVNVRDNICWGSGSGNDAQDPLFVNAAAADFRLQSESPAINDASDGTDRGADLSSIGPGGSPSPSSSPCHTLTSANPVPSGFGASWNTQSSQKELLLKATCQSSTTDIEVGVKTNYSLYIWKTAYEWSGSSWKAVNLSCSGASAYSGKWCLGSATASIPTSANYYAAYSCFWSGSAWKCGCRDQACTQGLWQLQGIKK